MAARMRAAGMIVALSTSCSLAGLSNDLGGVSCEGMEASFCAQLDAVEPTGDVCMSWQCRMGQCVVDVRDDDGDRAPAAMCLPSGDPAGDCDDMDASNAPEGAEVCDGTDDDCDGRIDEGVASVTNAPLGEAIGSVDIGHVAYTVASDTGETLAVYATPGHGTRLAMLRTDRALAGPTHASIAVQQGTMAVMDEPRGLAAAALGSSRLAIGLVPAGCSRLVLGLASSTGSPTLSIDATHFSEGLPKVAGACPSDVSRVVFPALAAQSGGAILAAWLAAADGDTRECGAATPADVVVSSARASATSLDVAELPALLLGSSIDSAGPALLALDDSFLVAFVDEADGAVVVFRVRASDPGMGALTSEEVHREAIGGAADRGGVSLSRGRTADGATQVALAWRQGGCGVAARTSLRMLSVAATTTPVGTTLMLEGEGQAPRAAFHPALDQWALVSRRGDDLMATLVDGDGAILGPAQALAAAPGGRAHALVVGSGSAFAAFGWARGSDAGAFVGARVGCLPAD